MTVRKRKKKNILRGHRTHGHGDTKNGRGAGSRGGVGRAGSHKHKFTKYAGEFGIEKKQVIGKPIGPSMNLDQIEQMLPVRDIGQDPGAYHRPPFSWHQSGHCHQHEKRRYPHSMRGVAHC